MPQIHIEIPASLYEGAQELAKKENVSIDQLIASALGEKMSALMTEDYLTQRAKRGNRKNFIAVLDQAADQMPVEEDQL